MNISPTPRYWFPKAYADFVQRLRVASGFVLLVGFAWLSQPSIRSIAAGVPVSVAGLLTRAWAAGHLAKNEQLATSGPYARMRNPLYIGTLLAAAGIVIASRSAPLAAIFAVVFLLVYLPVIELEEQHLRSIFPGYATYAAHVHRFLPVSRWSARAQNFSWSLYKRNQEYKAALGFLIVLAWLLWKCWLLPK